jgi:hypothetical protein
MLDEQSTKHLDCGTLGLGVIPAAEDVGIPASEPTKGTAVKTARLFPATPAHGIDGAEQLQEIGPGCPEVVDGLKTMLESVHGFSLVKVVKGWFDDR